MTGKGGRASTGAATPKIEIVHFPKRTGQPRREDDAAGQKTEEIHTERIDTLVEERLTDPGEPPFHERTTEREMRAVGQLMTPLEAPAFIGMLEEAGATLSYHRARLRELVATTPPDRPLSDVADLSLFGHSLLEQGRLEEARVVFEGIVARDPDAAFPYSMLGSVYMAQGDDARALALFEAALSVDPDDPAARVHRAELRLKRGDEKLAAKDLDAVLAAADEGAEELLGRARHLRKDLPKKGSKRR